MARIVSFLQIVGAEGNRNIVMREDLLVDREDDRQRFLRGGESRARATPEAVDTHPQPVEAAGQVGHEEPSLLVEEDLVALVVTTRSVDFDLGRA